MSYSITQSGCATRASRPPTAGENCAESGALVSALQEVADREQRLRRELHDVTRYHTILAEEQEHRFANGLQFIVGTLERQSRVARTPEAKEQLLSASIRILALHRIQRRIQEYAQCDTVAFNEFLRKICGDLSLVLCPPDEGRDIVFEGVEAVVPTTIAIPLVLIINELITNAAKHAAGKVTVRFACDARNRRHVSVADDGPGLPVGFVPKNSKGLGIKIVSALVGQIGGEIRFFSEHEQGTCCTVSF